MKAQAATLVSKCCHPQDPSGWSCSKGEVLRELYGVSGSASEASTFWKLTVCQPRLNHPLKDHVRHLACQVPVRGMLACLARQGASCSADVAAYENLRLPLQTIKKNGGWTDLEASCSLMFTCCSIPRRVLFDTCSCRWTSSISFSSGMTPTKQGELAKASPSLRSHVCHYYVCHYSFNLVSSFRGIIPATAIASQALRE